MELPGWTTAGFDDSAWSDVERVAFEEKYPEARLLAYPAESARLMPRWDRRPQSVTVAIGAGDTAVFDLGQNMVGVARYSLRGPAGARGEFRFGETRDGAPVGRLCPAAGPLSPPQGRSAPAHSCLGAGAWRKVPAAAGRPRMLAAAVMAMTRTWKHAAVAAAAVLATAGVGTGVWAATQDGPTGRGTAANAPRAAFGQPSPSAPGCGGHGPSDWNGSGMMGDRDGRDDRGTWRGPWTTGGHPCGLTGTGQPVTSLAAAKARAQEYADRLGLRVGEVMQFSRNFYAELTTSDGKGATEVLVDPAGGAVWLEYGPAMMWNTDYDMPMHRDNGSVRISAAKADDIARKWLDEHRAGQAPGEAEAFPGYYTLHTVEGKTITGMLSVNAHTGQVWYHSWHGDFVAMSDD